MKKDASLTIIQMNDLHGYIETHPELFWTSRGEEYHSAGGLARIAAFIEQVRQERPGRVLAFDCGDTLHGTFPAVHTQGDALIPILNQIGFCAMTAHWEFAYGPEQFKELAGKLSYPVLAINCYSKDSGELFFEPYRILEAGGLRIGVIGIAATIVDKVMPPSYSKGLYFTLGNQELPGWINHLRSNEQVDLILVISHLGFPQEMKLAEEVDGINVLLSARTHNRLYQPALINNTIIIQSGSHGSFLGRLDLEIENSQIVDFRHQLIPVDENIPQDAEVQALANEILTPYRQRLAQLVGSTLTPLNRNTVLESTMDNFLLQSLAYVTELPTAFSNGWRYGVPVLPGAITLNDLHNIIPVNPPVSTVEITGDEIREMMEENLEHTFSRNPYNQMGGYIKRVWGLRLYIKIENPSGYRIQRIYIGSEPLKPDKVYQAVFVTKQGVPEKYGTARNKLDLDAVEAMQRYLSSRNKPVEAWLHGSIIAI